MKNKLFIETSPSKQEIISKQRRERARSEELEPIYQEERFQKIRIVEEGNSGENNYTFNPTKSEMKDQDSVSLKSKKSRARSLASKKDKSSGSQAHMKDYVDKRELLPNALQKQLTGTRRNKKKSLDEVISKLKIPSMKTQSKNLEKMRFLANVQQQELEMILKTRSPYYSSNSNSPQVESPLSSPCKEEFSPSPAQSTFSRHYGAANPSHFGRPAQNGTTEFAACEADMLSNSSKDHMSASFQQKIEFVPSTGELQFISNAQELPFDRSRSQTSSQHQIYDEKHENYQSYQRPNRELGLHNRNLQEDHFQNQSNFWQAENPNNNHFQPQQQQQPPFLQSQRQLPFSNNLSSVDWNPNVLPREFNPSGDQRLIPPIRNNSLMGQHSNLEQTITETFPSNRMLLNPLSNSYNNLPLNTINPRELADQQLFKITDFLAQKSGDHSATQPFKSFSNIDQPTNSSPTHQKRRSLNSQGHLSINLTANMNSLQLHSNLVPEKVVNSPFKMKSPVASRTNTDPGQLRDLIKSMQSEKNNPNLTSNRRQSEMHLLSNPSELMESPPLMHTGGASSLMNLDYNLHPRQNGDSLSQRGGSLVNLGFSGNVHEDREDLDKNAFVPLITTSKTDNTSISSYMRSKINNPIYPPATNFKTENFPSKPAMRFAGSQFEDPPLVSHTKSDPIDLRSAIRSFQTTNNRTVNQSLGFPFADAQGENLDNSHGIQNSQNIFGGENRRVNTNPTHIASLIKSMHSSTRQNDISQLGYNHSMPSIDPPRSQGDINLKGGTYNQNIGKFCYSEFQPIDSIPSIEDLERQSPLARSNTAPNDWKNYRQSSLDNLPNEGLNQDKGLLLHDALNLAPNQLNLTNFQQFTSVPVAANFSFEEHPEQGVQNYVANNNLHQQDRDVPVGMYGTNTDRISLRSMMNQDNQRTLAAADDITEDDRSITGLTKKFGNVNVHTSSNTQQSDLPLENQQNLGDESLLPVNRMELGEIFSNDIFAENSVQDDSLWGKTPNLKQPAASEVLNYNPNSWVISSHRQNFNDTLSNNFQASWY